MIVGRYYQNLIIEMGGKQNLLLIIKHKLKLPIFVISNSAEFPERCWSLEPLFSDFMD